MNIVKNNPPLTRNSGFTLIELVIVIIILGILAVIALPKFINMRSDANIAAIKGAKGSMIAAISLFKAKTITSGHSMIDVVEFSGVKGSHYLPWAATATATSFSANYSSPPEIFEAAGLNVNDWAYRIYASNGSYAVVATPKSLLDESEPVVGDVKATNCYVNYHWKLTGEPIITTVFSGC